MEFIKIYINSSVADIANEIPCHKLSELNRIANKERVEIIFFSDYCRIIGKKNQKVKVPKKITSSGEELLKWTENKIHTAWR